MKLPSNGHNYVHVGHFNNMMNLRKPSWYNIPQTKSDLHYHEPQQELQEEQQVVPGAMSAAEHTEEK